MLTTNDATVMLVASDFQATLEDVDRTLASTFKAAGNLPDAFLGVGIPANHSQKIYQRMSNAVARLVEGRGEVLSTVAHLQVIKDRSNCAETALGCPDGWASIVTPKGEADAAVGLPRASAIV